MENNTKKRKGFVQIQNSILLNDDLSISAKGLFCIIASVINIPNYKLKKNAIQKASKMGKDAFNRVWSELKTKGFLIQKECRDEHGLIYYEYELLDEPREEILEKLDEPATVCGKSDSGKADTLNNTLENNNFKNNNIYNNNIFINEFYNKVSSVVDEKPSIKKDRFDNFLKSLRKDEIVSIAKLEKTDAVSFYIGALDLYDDKSILNTEGFLRVAIKNVYSFIFSSQNKIKEYGYSPVYDKNNEIIDYKLACYI